MMKSMKSMMMGGAILLGLTMCLTSCEGTLDDVFGEWSRPTGNNSKQGDSSTTNATAITLDQTMKVLVKGGDALTITATVTPSEATFTWESSDEAVATVANGVVTPKGLGIATITAKSGDVKATCEVFVGNEVALSSSVYEAKNYDILKGDMGANSLTIPDGFKVALDGLTITNNQIVCSGDATIYLADGSTNSVTAPAEKAGIQIGGAGTTLTINAETAGTGILNVTGGDDGAGIGTGWAFSSNIEGGNITINGGVINATAGKLNGGAAGIGTGYASNATNTCGAITINGGVINATGSDAYTGSYAYVTGGAGIGTGGTFATTGSTSNQCGAITINGGTVTATGAQRAVGIGTGTSYAKTISDDANNTCGAITIGTGITSVAAIKGSGAAWCIGKGPGYNGATTNCGTITIGGVVKAQSDFTGATYTYPEP